MASMSKVLRVHCSTTRPEEEEERREQKKEKGHEKISEGENG